MIDSHIPDARISNGRAPLVGLCRFCGGECCNCRACYLAKDAMFNICARCAKARKVELKNE